MNQGEIMGFADLHTHTTHSWDGASSVQEVLEYSSLHTNLDMIAITDHDCIDGALEALKFAPSYNIQVIPGIEVSTIDGHLLCLFVTEQIPSGLWLEETILRTIELNGLCIVPHPMMDGRLGISPNAVHRSLLNPHVALGLVGVETFNAGFFGAQHDPPAISSIESLSLSKVGCSDAHVHWAVGMGSTRFPGQSVSELRLALQNRQTEAVGNSTMQMTDFAFNYLPRMVRRYVGRNSLNNAQTESLHHVK
jgi:predicted metal-dependent phosphoesterase TrpH